MNKYHLTSKAIEADNVYYELLLNIANELAEANRLKRIEMENTNGLNVEEIRRDGAI